eukprot:TRINITY_DN7993_c0_g1_i9.p1 TRINITY_DN7993_c0_g1~~TRINITY_DN7993_c0_g1_i9.p1  ORF type:complete len:216 (-),score=25.84 TRINITY_DN7993_c0_g1_i9:222-869(-)
MIIKIVQKIGFFLVVLGIAIVAFAHGFFLLFRSGGDEGAVFDNWIVLLTMYTSMLGGFDFSTLAGGDQTQYTLGTIYLSVFIFFVSIVMLNLLIALMGDIYSGVQENVENEWLLERAKIILDLEPFISEADKRNKENFPSWVHILTATSTEEDSGPDNYYFQLSKTIHQVAETLRGEVRALEQRTRAKMDERLDATEARLGESLNKLTQLLERRG